MTQDETRRRFEHLEGAIAMTREEMQSLFEIVMNQYRELEALKRKVNGRGASGRRSKKYRRR